MAGLNTGTPVRLALRVSASILDEADDNLFGPKDFVVDWSLFDFESAGTFLVKPGDNIPVIATSGSSTVEVVLIKTTAPIDVNFTQDAITKTIRVRPLVKPSGFFANKASPSQAPIAISPGICIVTGGGITALALTSVGTDVQVAKVLVAVVGYNAAP